jgi:hypothetical protein
MVRALLLVLAFGMLGPALAVADDAAAASQARTAFFNTSLQPLLTKYCIDCHSGSEPEAELSLDRLQIDKFGDDRVHWEKVSRMLASGDMPPADAEQPDPQQRDVAAKWIDQELSRIICGGPRDPGRVTIRRLNRVEYNNTIRDLLAIDFRPADDFPSDDVGYGFDNIGDVLSLPPLLLEKYLAAARQIADRAIVDQSNIPIVHHVEGNELRRRGEKTQTNGTVAVFASETELRTRFGVAAAGDYWIRAKAYADQAGDEPAKMALRCDNAEVQTVDVRVQKAAPEVYQGKIHLEPGDHRLSVAFLNDYYNPSEQDESKRDRNLYVVYAEVAGPIDVDPSKLPESHKRIVFQQSEKENEPQVAREILKRFAARGFRRPTTDGEIDRLMKLFELARKEGDSFEGGIKLAVQAILVSPHFLFRVESDPEGNDPTAIRTISDFELASRLSYFLWSTMPDDELFKLAEAGTLRQGDNLHSQIQRMLRDPKSQELVSNFAGQWLQLRNLKTSSPDTKRFASFNDALRSDMQKETELFFATVMREDRSVLDFLNADYSFVNERLAKHYGLSGVEGDEFRRVSLPAEQRGGVLTHASVLTVTSNPTRTSPVKRGKWVLENLFNSAPPPPPPNVPELEDTAEAELQGSLRQRMEQHRAKTECAVCHTTMDPLGFGLENFDAVGAWRTQDGQFPVDPSGTLPGGRSFTGPKELREILLTKREQFVRCLAEKLLTYGLGRGLEYYDRCAVNEIVAASEKQDYKFSSLVLAIVHSDPFQKRRAKGDGP